MKASRYNYIFTEGGSSYWFNGLERTFFALPAGLGEKIAEYLISELNLTDKKENIIRTVDLAKAVLRIMQLDNHRYGIYHYSNEGNITWYDFSCEIYRQGKRIGLIKRACSVVPCTSSEFPQKAHRPSFSLLNKQKIKETFSLSVPNWNESLSSYLKELL